MLSNTIKMLEVGAGQFSFLGAFVAKKHTKGQVIPEITVTEIMTEEEAKSARKTKANILSSNYYPRRYSMQPVKFLFEVDATKLNENLFLEARYHAIRFNMPHNRAKFTSGLMATMIEDFFKAASSKQKTSDKVYLVIPQPVAGDKKSNHYYLCYYGIYNASVSAGYVLHRKRKFSEICESGLELRYPGYQHIKTSEAEAAASASNARELVFIKIELTPEEIRKNFPPRSSYVIDRQCEYPQPLDTDDESDDGDFEYLQDPTEDHISSISQLDKDQDGGDSQVSETEYVANDAVKRLRL
jgi:hypothetical protein